MEALYQRGSVSVDRDFARFGSKSFAIRQINSVDVREEKIKRTQWWAVSGLVGIVVILNSLSPLSVQGIVVAAVIFGLSYFLWQGSKGQPTHRFRLFVTASSTEAQAYETTDRSDVLELRRAIETAMIA